MKKQIKLAAGLVAATALLAIGVIVYNDAQNSAQAVNTIGSGPILSAGTSYANSYYASNTIWPASLAAGGSTNLWYKIDTLAQNVPGAYKDLSLQFTGSTTAGSMTNSVAITLAVNDDGSTNTMFIGTWTIGITNAATTTNSQTALTNLSTANNMLGGHRFLYIGNITTTSAAGSGSAVLTNWYMAYSPK